MMGCEGLVHAAGEVYGGGNLESTRAVNVEGTRRILAGGAASGVRRAVHISTVAVYGQAHGPMAESSSWAPGLPARDVYAQTKREAEGVAGGFHGRDGLQLTILRPPAVFGERDRRFIPRVAKVLSMRLIFLMGSGQNRLALVYAGNVAEAVERALGGSGSGGIFNVTEDVPVTQRSLFSGLGRELGVRPYFVTVPGSFVRIGARVGDQLGLGIPGTEGLSLSRAADLSLNDNPYPAEKAREGLGWDPPYSLAEALSRTGRWLREKDAGHD